MNELVEHLCSEACAGRAPGTPGGTLARGHVVEALRAAGLDPFEQGIPGCGGANVLATVRGDMDRWIVVGAHYDHLGRDRSGNIYYGADDNAAAVAILADVAGALAARRPAGCSVLFASFDAEEPPHFLTERMGSEHYARNPHVPLERTSLMVCMDLVGHALGPPGLPAGVRQTLFALGAERSRDTASLVDATTAEGVVVRRADADIIPPLSDYQPFWTRKIPFLFLTGGRSRVYHTPSDRPSGLDYPKMRATARWLEGFVRSACEASADGGTFVDDGNDDASTLRSIVSLTDELAGVSPMAAQGRAMASSLLAACDRDGHLPAERRAEVQMLVGAIESGLA